MNREEMWKLHVHNAAFDIQMALQTLQQTLRAVAGDDAVMLANDLCAFDRQIAVMRAEARTLVSFASRAKLPPRAQS